MARSVAHVHNIVRAGANSLLTYPFRPFRMKMNGLARRLFMSKEALEAALRYPTSADHLRSGLLRVKAEAVGPVLFKQPYWDVRFIPCGQQVMTGADWFALYHHARGIRGLLTQLREYYKPLSENFEGVPLLVVDMLARGVGYPCGVRVIKTGETIYERRHEVMSPRHQPRSLVELLEDFPMIEREIAARTGYEEIEYE